MDDPTACAICGNPIEAGQAWMEGSHEGERLRAHAACLYADDRDSETAWEPQEHAAE